MYKSTHCDINGKDYVVYDEVMYGPLLRLEKKCVLNRTAIPTKQRETLSR